MKLIIVVFVIAILTEYSVCYAAESKNKELKASASKQIDKPLQVNGQTRNLSMMLVLKSEKEKITFVDVRRNFKDKKTDY